MIYQTTITPASKLLGSRIKALRLHLGMTPLDLGRKVNQPLQQIVKFEEGHFIALAMLEELGLALGAPIAKKIIRRISFLRKLELELGEEQSDLAEIYGELFAPEEDENLS